MNIIIVGGGTAGWLAALMVSRITPEHTVTVIESSKIGIVGAGEGSTGLFTNILANRLWEFDCDIIEFLIETGATFKYGIEFKDWHSVGKSFLAPLGGSPEARGNFDGAFALQNTYNSNYLHLVSDIGHMMEYGHTTYKFKDFQFKNYDFAFHFDAHKVGKYFQKKSLLKDNVTVIDAVVTRVIKDNNNFISTLKLDNGQLIHGDFFIDASGFARILMKEYDNKWKSYRENLPVNSAMPFLLPYKDGEYPKPWTTAWAQKNGWMWQIPIQERKGCGYVFCDDFITPEKAQDEIEQVLGTPIDPIKILKFDTGRLEDAWINNCLAVGLSSAFAEPLQATSIHSTIVQLTNFVFDYLERTPKFQYNSGKVRHYNKITAKLYDDFKDFLNLHYMGGRTDSEFWRYITNNNLQTDNTKNLIEFCKSSQPTNKYFETYFGCVGWELYCYILTGTGNLSAKVSEGTLDIYRTVNHFDDLEKKYDEFQIDCSDYYKDCISYIRFIDLIKSRKK